MKRIYGIVLVTLLMLVVGCTPVETGKYKEGTYIGTDSTSGQIAVIYVDSKGMIKSAFVDAAYSKKNTDGTVTATTKQILGDAYGMKNASSNVGTIEGGAEWYEQIKNLTDKVVKEQGIDWLEFKYRVTKTDGTVEYTSTKPSNQTETNKAYTDSVAGVTIQINGSYNAIKNALDQAKK